MLTELNSRNPQVTSRLIEPLIRLKRYDEKRQALMRRGAGATEGAGESFRGDLFEKIGKALACNSDVISGQGAAALWPDVIKRRRFSRVSLSAAQTRSCRAALSDSKLPLPVRPASANPCAAGRGMSTSRSSPTSPLPIQQDAIGTSPLPR